MSKNFSLKYSSGWWLRFKAHGIGPRLFLEWIGSYYNKQNRISRLTFSVRTEDDPEELLNDVMVIYNLFPITRADIDNLKSYMESNLDN